MIPPKTLFSLRHSFRRSQGVVSFCSVVGLLFGCYHACGATVSGHVRDPNWYARYQDQPYGVGYYEYGVNANPLGEAVGGDAATDVFGAFSMQSDSHMAHTVVSWDVWWRSAYVFGVPIPRDGNAEGIDLRLKATMWGYPAFWDDDGYYEFGQTFVATGPVSMIYLRCPFDTGYTLTVHEGGPGGPRIGESRSFRGGDQRPVYGYGEMPTIAGRTYYVRIRTSSPTVGGVIRQMDPRPDFSDPMPGGCLWLGDGNGVTPYPGRDLGLVIMSDDDGLLTNLFIRPGGGKISGNSVGQTFIARGTGIISIATWLPDPSAPVYVIRVYENGPGGSQVGPAKRGRPPRVTADPEMIVAWAPGECPVVPGNSYYFEVTRDDGGVVQNAYSAPNNPFPHGHAYRQQTAMAQSDLAGTIMEERAPGSATRPQIQIIDGPEVRDEERGSRSFVVRWTTDVLSDGIVEIAANHPPYHRRFYSLTSGRSHAVTVSNLIPHTLYHFRVSAQPAEPVDPPLYRPIHSRDRTLTTLPEKPNLLANADFEEGTGSSPRRNFPSWQRTPGIDMATSDGTWFWGLDPRKGDWLFEGAVNAGNSKGHIYQTVNCAPGKSYTFSAWITTLHRENDTYKYDVWNDPNRLIYVRLGIDPTGGTNPDASSVQWTPRFYSHLRYSNAATSAIATGRRLTVFIQMQGTGGQWHVYGVDDCVLTETEPVPPLLRSPVVNAEGRFQMQLIGEPNVTYQIQSSTNLVDWSNLHQITYLVAPTNVVDDVSPSFEGLRFYRASR